MSCSHLKSLCIAGFLLMASTAVAQTPDPVPAPTQPKAAQPAQPEAQAVPAPADQSDAAPAAQPDPAPSDEPGDVIANYFKTMGDIVAQNQDSPDALVEKFAAYIKDNEKAMRAASKKFDAKMASLKSNESEVYRETVQRKITPQLNNLISLLIEFSGRYPAKAQKLDSLLKVDAKYTYQQ